MRSVVVCLGAFALLSGCATVSMIPGQTIVESNLSAEQSALRQSAEAYIDLAEDEHWVAKSSSLFDLARVLVDGASGDNTVYDYAKHIDADGAPVEEIEARLVADLDLSRKGLAGVTQEAKAVMEVSVQDRKSLRGDVTQFEKALVTAQKTRRSFTEVRSILTQRTAEEPQAQDFSRIDDALTALDLAIEAARKTADDLADLYANAPSAIATS